jgi:predicted transposase YbfD/YdcC
MDSTDALEADFPHARSLMAVRGWRGRKNDLGEPHLRYFISSLSQEQMTHEQGMDFVRGHWGGIENRNHWRRDACLSEDRTRSKNTPIVANLALLRNALLKIVEDHKPTDSTLPAFCETILSHPKLALKFILCKRPP